MTTVKVTCKKEYIYPESNARGLGKFAQNHDRPQMYRIYI